MKGEKYDSFIDNFNDLIFEKNCSKTEVIEDNGEIIVI